MLHSAIQTQQLALRNAYLADQPQHAAIHHLNLANQLAALDADPAVWLEQQVAGTILLFQADSDLLPDALGNLALVYVQFAPRKPPVPRTFDALANTIDQVDGLAFRRMTERLAENGGASGDEALHAVLGLAATMAG
ncbi:MAG: hypothetical protein WAZ19_08050 [Anaerolineae bacterium]